MRGPLISLLAIQNVADVFILFSVGRWSAATSKFQMEFQLASFCMRSEEVSTGTSTTTGTGTSTVSAGTASTTGRGPSTGRLG